MTGFLSELGKHLAERWLTLLVLPGALWVGVAVGAGALGYDHPFDIGLLVARVTGWTETTTGQVTLVAGLLAVAAGVGLAAEAVGSAVERVVLAANWRTWWQPCRGMAGSVVRRREKRWVEAHREYHQLGELAYQARVEGRRLDAEPRLLAYRRRTRIAPEYPDRPTWSGDRLNAVVVRLDRDLHVDLATVWPSLWLVLAEEHRSELTTRRQALTRGATLTGWGLVYAPLIVWWWPAALVAGITILAGRYRIRTAADGYAELLEASVRTHLDDLAEKLGVAGGDALTALLHSEPAAPEET